MLVVEILEAAKQSAREGSGLNYRKLKSFPSPEGEGVGRLAADGWDDEILCCKNTTPSRFAYSPLAGGEQVGANYTAVILKSPVPENSLKIIS